MRSKIIAEISSNHLGDMVLAKEIIAAAAEAGADIVKFQSWQVKNLRADWPDREWYEKTELSDENHFELIDECKKRGVEFLTTCFDRKRINFLKTLGLEKIKVASPDLSSFSMLREIRENFKYPIVSTGMSNPDEIIQAAEILKKGRFAFLHCVSIYPTPLDKLNLKKIEWLRKFTPDVGFSDHSLGIFAAMLAITKGAVFIEKHFTLNREFPGKDHKISILPEELKALSTFRDIAEKSDAEELKLFISEEEIKTKEQFSGRWGNNK